MMSDYSNKPIRVLMICPQFKPLVGGYERAAERLSVALAERGHEVVIAAERRNLAWPSVEAIGGATLCRWWCIYRPGLHIATSLFGLAMLLLRQGRRFQVWHVHQYGMQAALAVVMGKLLRRPVVLKLTTTGQHGLAQTIAQGRFSRLIAALHRRVDAVVALTRETAAEAEAFGIPKERIHILGNGVDTGTFRPRSEEGRAQLKQKLGLGNARVVLFVGRLAEAKNIEGLIQAWQHAATQLPLEWQLVVVGDGPLRGKGEQLAKQYGIINRVRFVGQQPNVDEWMGAADLYVSTSWREGLSNTLLEAMASGLPIVATKVSGVPELVEATGAGLAVEVGDMGEIAYSLTELALDSSRRRKIGAIARQYILSFFAIEAVADKHVTLYRSLHR